MIFTKTILGIADGTDDLVSKVRFSAMEINQPTGGRIPIHAVDGEITPCGILLKRGC